MGAGESAGQRQAAEPEATRTKKMWMDRDACPRRRAGRGEHSGSAAVAGMVAIGALAVLLAVGQWALPAWVSGRLSTALQEATRAQDARVQVQAMPASRLLQGRLDQVDIWLRDGWYGQLQVAQARVTATGLVVDLDALRRHAPFTQALRSAQSVQGTLTVDEAGLNDYFWSQMDPGRHVHWRLKPGRVRLEGSWPLPGAKAVPLVLEGHFLPVSGDRLHFTVDQLQVAGRSWPASFLDQLFPDLLSLPVQVWQGPIPLYIRSVETEEGRLVLQVSSHAEPAPPQ
ncbi:MAG: DUF2993 domain-containing protein [Firmicutes bacterium]|nr:DUF2993 domain-containing protein [Bacillota bacterium]